MLRASLQSIRIELRSLDEYIDWEVKDRDLIIEKGEEGFKQIKRAYKPNYKNISDEDTETVESRS